MSQSLIPEQLRETIRTSKMTEWFNLKILSGTLKNIIISELLGDRFDYRIGMANTSQPYFDYSQERGEFWFDYAADVGDGFSPTFAIARLFCDSNLRLAAAPELPPSPGRLLLLGGDEVYPSANRNAYQQRLVIPYSAAYYQPATSSAPCTDLFAIPGNHDWYDGLGSFVNLFTSQRRFGRFQTRQRRSYFAMRLPHQVWLLALDIALDGEVDISQLHYFVHLITHDVPDDASLILCTAEPDWIRGTIDDSELRTSLFVFEKALMKAAQDAGKPGIRLVLRLAGDLHYYKHFISQEPVPGQPGTVTAASDTAALSLKVTPAAASAAVENYAVHSIIAGGGGAFLHPTHNGLDDSQLSITSGLSESPIRFVHQKSYPAPDVSRELGKGGLFILKYNKALWLVLLLIYIASGLAYSLAGAEFLQDSIEKTYGSKIGAIAVAATLQFLVLVLHSGVLYGCCYAIVDISKQHQLIAPTDEERHRSWIAFQHALWHILPYTLLQAAHSIWSFFFNNKPVSANLVTLAIAGVCSVLSAIVFGMYLRRSLNRHGRHVNDAFAALRIEGYKSFLRIVVKPEQLVVYAVGLDAVPTEWVVKDRFIVGQPCAEPAAGQELKPHLVDQVTIPLRPLSSR